MTEISWGFFSRRQKVIIPVYLTSFDDFQFFDKKIQFLLKQSGQGDLALGGPPSKFKEIMKLHILKFKLFKKHENI